MPDTILDVFHTDAFNVINLTDALSNLTFVPGRVGQMGLFTPSGLTTTTAVIEQRNDMLVLIPPSPRGGPGQTLDKQKRNVRTVMVPHFEINDAIMAEEVQGIRAFGTANEVETVMAKVAERGSRHTQSFAATTEYAQIGAIKGLVTYADSTTLDLAALFGVSLLGEQDFDLDNANPAAGALRKKCAAVTRIIANELDGIPWAGRLHAFCGDNFFDDLLAHSEVRATYEGWPEARILREGYIDPAGKVFGAFEFGNIVWENYRGAYGGTAFVNTDKCHIFPLGVPDLFRTYYAPADYIETVNTVGQRLYAKQYDMPNGKGIHMDVQMNELNICTRPRLLQLGKRT